MCWRIEGADKVTGKDRVLRVVAPSAREAEEMALKRGLYVSRIWQERVRLIRADTSGAGDAAELIGRMVSERRFLASLMNRQRTRDFSQTAEMHTVRSFFLALAIAAYAISMGIIATMIAWAVSQHQPLDLATLDRRLLASAIAAGGSGIAFQLVSVVAGAVRSAARCSAGPSRPEDLIESLANH